MKHGDLSRTEWSTVTTALGADAVRAINKARTPDKVKYGELTFGQEELILNKLVAAMKAAGYPENFDLFIKNDLGIKFEKIIHPLLNRHGNCIAAEGLKAVTVDENRSFHLPKPFSVDKFPFKEVYSELTSTFSQWKFQSLEDYKTDSLSLFEEYSSNPQTANFQKRYFLFLPIPHISGLKNPDYLGEVIHIILEKLEEKYRSVFQNPKRDFYRLSQEQLVGKVSVFEGLRYANYLQSVSQKPQTVIFSPHCLQGFSVYAQQEQESHMPDNILLSGIEILLAGIARISEILRDYHTPGYDTVLQHGVSRSLYLRAYFSKARLDDNGSLSYPYVFSSGGFLFLSSAK